MLRSRFNQLLKQFEKTYTPLNVAKLSRRALLHNFDLLEALSPGTIIPVVKANAYGHGLQEVVQILKARRFPYLAVDGYFEALKIREVSSQPVLIMGAIGRENYHNIKLNNFAFVVHSLGQVEALGKRHRQVKVHLEVNTGMHRHGTNEEDLPAILKAIKRHRNIKLEGVMSHLADADNPSNQDYTNVQIQQFDGLVEKIRQVGFKPKLIHLAQTAGSAKIHSRFANAIRPGIGLYGINPLMPNDAAYRKFSQLQPVMELTSRLGLTRKLKPGDRVSYNGTFEAKRNMTAGVLPLGYAEGLPRSLSNAGVVKSGNQYLPIVGKVCMNHTIIDTAKTKLQEGNEVIVISSNPSDRNSVAAICKQFHFFNYRFITAINASIRRQIVD